MIFFQYFLDKHTLIFVLKWQCPVEHLKENDTKGPPVNAFITLTIAVSYRFGCHVRNTTFHFLRFFVCVIKELRYSKISQFNIAIRFQQDVLELEIVVYDLRFVQEANRYGDLCNVKLYLTLFETTLMIKTS